VQWLRAWRFARHASCTVACAGLGGAWRCVPAASVGRRPRSRAYDVRDRLAGWLDGGGIESRTKLEPKGRRSVLTADSDRMV
jgi:hypothetical protein